MNMKENNNLNNLEKGSVLNDGYMYSDELVFIEEGPCDTLECINRETGKPFRLSKHTDKWKKSGEVVHYKELEYLESMKKQFLRIEELNEEIKTAETYREQTRGLYNFLKMNKREEIKAAIMLSRPDEENVILAFSTTDRISKHELLNALKQSKNLIYMDLAKQEYDYRRNALVFDNGCRVYKYKIFYSDCSNISTCCPLREVLVDQIRRSELIVDLVKEREKAEPPGQQRLFRSWQQGVQLWRRGNHLQ